MEFYFNEDAFLLTAKAREAAMASRTLRDFFLSGFFEQEDGQTQFIKRLVFTNTTQSMMFIFVE